MITEPGKFSGEIYCIPVLKKCSRPGGVRKNVKEQGCT